MPVSRRGTILDDLRIGDEKRAYGGILQFAES